MAIKIEFDAARNPEQPTVVLAKKSGEKLGVINAKSVEIRDNLNDASELSFTVYKETDGIVDSLWDDIVDFKLVYCVEWNTWFEITVELDESNESVKTVTGTKLGHAELGQIMLYTIEINTEDDIAREEYKEPTVFYNPENPKASLLNRLMEKASHYKITHVDSSLMKIQRTFSFDETSLYDAFQEVAEEINCLFVFPSQSDGNGKLQRNIEVYDLESNCIECGYRGEFIDKCPECGSDNIIEGYGDDTGIFVTYDELAESIGLSTDTDSVKNCFKLEAGDDLMNATIRSCNPNGTDYIWYITDDMKSDMSDSLVSKLNEYDSQYDYYQNEYIVLSSENEMLVNYNALVDKYVKYNDDIQRIPVPINGYQQLMNAYFNTIDLELYLESGLMPSVEISDTTAIKEAAKLTSSSLSPCAYQNVKNMSLTTANNVVLSMAKIVADSSRYKIKVANSSLAEQTSEEGEDAVNVKIWTGSFELTSYSDEEDIATSETIVVEINDEYELFVKQKLDTALANMDVDDMSISGLFKMDIPEFKEELKKYSRNRLTSFQDACQTCIDILIEQGISDKETWSAREPNLYDDLYLVYLDKMSAIGDEMKVRDSEIAIIVGTKDEYGEVETIGLQNYLEQERSKIQSILDFSKFIGDELWIEFCSFRREDKYSNDNYISDGLDNAELFDRAREFIKMAQKEIYKSAELQKSVSTTMNNLLVIKKFDKLVDSFVVGNWIRVFVDDDVYRLRLISYDIDYDDMSQISVDFSDITKWKDSATDIKDVLSQASSMATSYDTVKRQAKKGTESKSQLDNWAENGLSLTNTKIVGNADNQNVTWDSHGILCREYLPMLDEYDDKQLKIINKGLYVTDDGWKTSRAGIGNFMFYNPETSQVEEGYGVIADTIVGNLILSEKVGIYNESGSVVMNENGVVITSTGNKDDEDNNDSNNVFVIQSKTTGEDGEDDIKQLLYIDDSGNLVLNGTIRINSVYDVDNDMGTIDDIVNPDRYTSQINDAIKIQMDSMNNTIQEKYESVVSDVNKQLNNYKAEVGQYMRYGSEGLVLGAEGSEFSTVIDNRGMYFKQGNDTVSYIRDSQLYIKDAVIENTLLIGKFFFSNHYDGSVSLTWQDD